MKYRLWRMLHKSLPLAHLLAPFIMGLSPSCVVCGAAVEDLFHLFRDCPLAGTTWTRFLPVCDPNSYNKFFALDWQEWLEFNLSNTLGTRWHIIFAVVC